MYSTNTKQNQTLLSRPGTQTHVLTIFKNKILDFDARVGPVTKKVMDKFWLVDLSKRARAKTLAASGAKDASIGMEDDSRSPAYKDLLKEYAKQQDRVNNSFESPHNILKPAGAAGQVIDTAYEVVRRINFLQKVAGKSYLMERFQARNVVNIESKEDLNFKGFTQDELLEGTPEIGDNITPDPVKPAFSFFEKQIFADSFRYEFGVRDRKDSQIGVVERLTRQIPGIMEKMVNDKITSVINAKISSLDVPDWDVDADANGIFDNDASEHVEDMDVKIQDYDGEHVIIGPRKVIRLYLRNVQGRNVVATQSGQTSDGRSGVLPANEHIKYFIDNHITSNTLTLIAKQHFIDMYDGPKVEVSYKNELTPAHMEGRILFHFNGIKKKLDSAADKNNGFT